MTERGVSEALGFVLVFSLVTGTVAVVYVTGITGLQDAQGAEKVRNVERAFDVLADNVYDLQRSAAPSRATEVKLAGGSIGTGDPVTIRVRAERSTNASVNATWAVTFDPIVYRDDDGTSVVYSDGAVIRSQSDGSVVLGQPRWVVGPNRTVLPLVNTYGSGESVGGEGAVLIVTERETRKLGNPFEAGAGATAEVNVTVSSPRAEAWGRLLAEEGFTPKDDDPTDGDVTYGFETDELYVPKTGIRVSFER